MIEILKRKKSNKGVKFHYGEIERILFKYLQDNKYITINKFIQLAEISYPMASRTLVKLVLANVLRIDAQEDNDLFSVNENV